MRSFDDDHTLQKDKAIVVLNFCFRAGNKSRFEQKMSKTLSQKVNKIDNEAARLYY